MVYSLVGEHARIAAAQEHEQVLPGEADLGERGLRRSRVAARQELEHKPQHLQTLRTCVKPKQRIDRVPELQKSMAE